MVAIESGHLNIAKVLIEAETDVNRMCAENETALSHFALKGNEQGVQFLRQSEHRQTTNWATRTKHC